jgi:hypothetical protein
MENTITVKSVKTESWCFDVTYEDKGKEWTKKVKKDAPGSNLIAVGKMLTLTLDKNDKGYWEVTKVENAGDALAPPTQPQPAPQNNQGKIEHNGNKSNRVFATAWAKDLCVAGKIGLNHIVNCTDWLEAIADGKITADGANDTGWMIPAGESKLVDKVRKINRDAAPE